MAVSPLAVLRGAGRHLGGWCQVLLALVWLRPGPLRGGSWGSRCSIRWPSRGTRGQSQLLLACLDASVGLLVQWDVAALPGIQVEQLVFYNCWVKALLPQFCLL